MRAQSPVVTLVAVTILAGALVGWSSGGFDKAGSATAPAAANERVDPAADPAVTYPQFPLVNETQFDAAILRLDYTGVTPDLIGTAGFDWFSSHVRLTISPSTAGTFKIIENGEEASFGASDLITPPAPANPSYLFRAGGPSSSGPFSELELLNNSIKDQASSDPARALSWTSHAIWRRDGSGSGEKRTTVALFGYPTFASDMPVTGTSRYSVRVAGRWVGWEKATFDRIGLGTTSDPMGATTSELTVDFDTGVITLTADIYRGTPPWGTRYMFLNARGRIIPGTNRFAGYIRPDTSSDRFGTFQGSFFGPQAAEIGMTMAFNESSTSRTVPVITVVTGKSCGHPLWCSF